LALKVTLLIRRGCLAVAQKFNEGKAHLKMSQTIYDLCSKFGLDTQNKFAQGFTQKKIVIFTF